jgi:hypothetical protein
MSEPKKDHYDDEDVAACLKRETEDGPGFDTEDDLPESDFDGFESDDVEMTTEDPK